MNFTDNELNFLNLLSEKFPTIAAASTEIINLQAILYLPKGTEHFLSDIHGEFESFQHVIKNASGVIKSKIDELFYKEMTSQERIDLAFLIYYPEEKLDALQDNSNRSDTSQDNSKRLDEWYELTLFRLIRLSRLIASQYTRSKVRKSLPSEFKYIIEELLHELETSKEDYYNQIIRTIIELGRSNAFIIEISKLIQRLAIDHLHIIGDIFDRGSGAHLIMDLLMEYHSADIQWGNHDILWMGAAAGSEACIANVLRMAFRYGGLDTLEDGYGINLRPLWNFALEAYAEDSCEEFMPKSTDEISEKNRIQLAKLHKAITIIQFKLEAEIINRRPHYNMQDRLLLGKINPQRETITIEDAEYPLLSCKFPTVDFSNPYKLTDEEREIVKQIKLSFLRSEKLQKHVRFLYSKGSLYKIYNNNLLFHGCILLNEDKKLMKLIVKGEEYSGKSLMDRFDRLARQGYFAEDKEVKHYGEDILWYLWSGAFSPLFGKKKMATFERYFLKNKELQVEEKNPYYNYRNDEDVCRMILREFGLNPDTAHIINGHVPVKAIKGESPEKANGKLFVIDGGFSKAYQQVTGIAGYTLIYDSLGMKLVAHQPFISKQEAIKYKKDIDSQVSILRNVQKSLSVRDTDIGQQLMKQVEDCKKLLAAYWEGIIIEQ